VKDLKKMKFVATGDSLVTMRQSIHDEQEFMDMLEIIWNSDVAFTNLEMLIHDYGEDCYPAADCGGTYTRAPAYILEELMWMGFDLYATANNHSMDYSYGGLLSTIEWLEEYGLPHAGTGRDLSEALMPAYLEAEVGRVALLAATSTFASFGRAGDARRDMKGRPGINPLRYEKWYEAKPESIDKLKQVHGELGLAEVHQVEGNYHFLHNKFVAGSDIGVHTKPNDKDMRRNVKAVRDASRQSDWLIFSLHAHEGVEGDPERPAEYIEVFARAVIDAGAHAFIGHGHHAMRGIEIREGKPIFYSLGNFIFQNETVQKMPVDFYERYGLASYDGFPSEAYDERQKAPPRIGYPVQPWFTFDEKYWISVLPYMVFEGNSLTELKLYPIDLGQNKPRSQRGRPMLSKGAAKETILEIIKKLSEPYGTEIIEKDGVGVVAL
jgi:poly-gamma-glutamate synthesis protein (capsule biosynthesis protein)